MKLTKFGMVIFTYLEIFTYKVIVRGKREHLKPALLPSCLYLNHLSKCLEIKAAPCLDQCIFSYKRNTSNPLFQTGPRAGSSQIPFVWAALEFQMHRP